MSNSLNSFFIRSSVFILIPFLMSCRKTTIEAKIEYATSEGCQSEGLGPASCSDKSSGRENIGEDITIWSNEDHDTIVIAEIPNGYYENKSCLLNDSELLSENIVRDQSIFGVQGGFRGRFGDHINSMAHRNPGSIVVPNNGDLQSVSLPLTLAEEVGMFVAQGLPNNSSHQYREIPDQNVDDDGYMGLSCNYAPRPTVTCGTTQATIEGRIADCFEKNGNCTNATYLTPSACEAQHGSWTTTAIWDGAQMCNSGQGKWRLVTRMANNKEVWRDQRTGLLWSSVASGSMNWCRASGNTEFSPPRLKEAYNTTSGTALIGTGNISKITGGRNSQGGTVSITFQNPPTHFTVTGASCGDGTLISIGSHPGAFVDYHDSLNEVCSFRITQGSIPFAANDIISLDVWQERDFGCSPGASGLELQPASPLSVCVEQPGLNPVPGETWAAGGYISAKGGMGKSSTPSVSWRLPTTKDYLLAEINGIRFVVPDMGLAGSARPNPDSSPGGPSNSEEWVATTKSDAFRAPSQYIPHWGGQIGFDLNYYTINVRCVGR